MEKKIIYIKIKDGAIEGMTDRFKSARREFYSFAPISHNAVRSNLINNEIYYFFALVYDANDKNKIIDAFLGKGTYREAEDNYPSLSFRTEFSGLDNNAISNLIKISNLDINTDFNNNFVMIESSEYIFEQLDFILSDPGRFQPRRVRYQPLASEERLHPLAQRNQYCRRQYDLCDPQPDRGEFQRDYERIIHSKVFRRMVDKAQVFSASKGDHYRTRMTHSQVVAQIARTVAAELGLNLNLTEAIALGHDLGHTPFGHQGERTLNDILCGKIDIIKNLGLFEDQFGGFKHNYQSVRVASMLEETFFDIDGMDLSYQTLEGMLKHTKFRKKPFDIAAFTSAEEAAAELRYGIDFCSTLEGQAVAISDEIAQRGHDLDDALASGIISLEEFRKYMTVNKAESIDKMLGELFGELASAKDRHRHFSDENELMHSRVVSAIIEYLTKDVIAGSKKAMSNYPLKKFQENGYAVDARLIDFSSDAARISNYLETINASRVINSTEIALFDNNAATIVASLFKTYYNDPRLIHKGTQRRICAEIRRFTNNVVNFESAHFDIIRDEIEKMSVADLTKIESEPMRKEYMAKRRVLVRCICDFISGMTDTYATQEYNRIQKLL